MSEARPPQVRVIALGNPWARDDGAAAKTLSLLAAPDFSVFMDMVQAGRPGVGLLDLLQPQTPVILLDALDAGGSPGSCLVLPLDQLSQHMLRERWTTSHALEGSGALLLGQALQRPLPPGFLVGVQGQDFSMGTDLSPAVAAALPLLAELVQACALALAGQSPSPDSGWHNTPATG